MTDPLPPSPVWKSIAAEIRDEIAAGCYPPGSRLPTEAMLSRRFGVNRHTVRHALSALVDEGLVVTRRGSGAFVAQRPTDYALGRRVRFHQNLAAAGRVPGRSILGIETRPAAQDEAAALDLAPGAPVHAVDGLSSADAQPIAVFRSVFPAQSLPDLPGALLAEQSVTRALALCGVPDYIRASTRLSAVAASPTQALHLGLRPGAPLLLSVAVNTGPDGRPVEYGRTWFAGDRVALTLASDPA